MLLTFMTMGAVLRAQTPTLHVETHLVTLTFSARDGGGKLVGDLSQDDFKVYEDGVEQKLRLFSRESELPLTLGLVVDASSSQDKFLMQHLRDIETFLHRVLRPQDQVFALCFGNHLRLASDLTSNPAQVIDGLERYSKVKKGDYDFPELAPDETREGGSAVYDAIFASVTEKLAPVEGRQKALILFTDGEENASAHDEIEAIAAAQQSDALIYAIRYTEIKHDKLTADNRHGIAALRHISEETGGRDFDALHIDLPQAFTQIGEELRSLYSIGYYSTNKQLDGRFRKVVIEPEKEGVLIRSRSGYYAK
ncbi:VWA domain-containing protein [Silvibacterium dinghuense]|uniref:VWA domain-containing protein n=1 Tax=Silvibacterium dinghuense TaxID=1560006 RepID=A0A4Q1SHH6_9BACT|nr:VWA domain-containing protein [Silvibacterium dinghuense]RXS97006.1 VWA domain-containing protein [Silvibacterium dinghuense]